MKMKIVEDVDIANNKVEKTNPIQNVSQQNLTVNPPKN
jgi:hypothetical protein